MKRKLIMVGLIVINSLFLFGCVDEINNKMDNPPVDNNKSITQKFTVTDFNYQIGEMSYKVIVDNETNNVYLHMDYGRCDYRVIDTFPLLDSDGKPVKYNSLKNN